MDHPDKFTVTETDDDTWRIRIGKNFAQQVLAVDWPHLWRQYLAERPNGMLKGEEKKLAYEAYRRQRTTTNIDKHSKFEHPVQAVLPALGTERPRTARDLGPGPTEAALLECLDRACAELVDKEVEVDGIPPHAFHRWRQETDVQAGLLLGPVGLLTALLRHQGRQVISEDSIRGKSCPDLANVPVKSSADAKYTVDEASVVYEVKTTFEDASLEEIACQVPEGARSLSLQEFEKHGADIRTGFAGKITKQVGIYAKESGAACVKVTTGPAAWLWIRRDVAPEGERWARDPPGGQIWDVLQIAGRHREETGQLKAPWKRWLGGFFSFLYVTDLWALNLRKFEPCPRSEGSEGSSKKRRLSTSNGKTGQGNRTYFWLRRDVGTLAEEYSRDPRKGRAVVRESHSAEIFEPQTSRSWPPPRFALTAARTDA